MTQDLDRNLGYNIIYHARAMKKPDNKRDWRFLVITE